MATQFTTTAASLLLLASGSLAIGAPDRLSTTTISAKIITSDAEAGGHEGVDALKAKIAHLNTSLEQSNTGREYLLTRLREEIAKNKAAESDNSDEMQRAVRGREFLGAQSKRNRQKLMAERKKNAHLSLALERALRGRDLLSDESDARGAALEAEKKESARLSLALERALLGRDFLTDEYNTYRNALTEEKKETARASLALQKALRDRDSLSDLVAETEAKVKAAELEADQIAEVSFVQINSAIEEANAAKEMLGSTEWADTLGGELSTKLGAIAGTEVTSLTNNSVAIKIGNTGLFAVGGTALSDDGSNILSEISNAIIEQGESNIKIVGHTDNIPTGSASRFASNNELSLARATSALSHMASIGVPTERLSASGVGDAYPIASNETREGRLLNRRVEILLTPVRYYPSINKRYCGLLNARDLSPIISSYLND